MKKKSSFFVKLIFVLIFLIIIIFTFVFIRKKIADKTVNIAFMGLPQDLCEMIQDELKENSKLYVNFANLADGNNDLGIIKKKYDMIFTWKGEITQTLSDSSEKIPSKLLENIPITLRDDYCVPILLDYFELDLNKELINKVKINPEDGFQSFVDYLHESKKYVFTPFLANGADNRTLLALTGSFVEALGGVEAYTNLIQFMQTYEKLEDFCDIGLNENGLCYKDILDMLKIWPKEEILHPQWMIANKIDFEVFAQDNQVAAFYTNLSEHRTLRYEISNKFLTIKMPVENPEIPHCIIGSAVSCVILSDNSNVNSFLKKLLNQEVQTRLSDKSMLAPVHYHAEAFDSLADDLRFWVASCEGGIIPDLSQAVFQRQPEKMEVFVQEIRNYLKS